MIAAPSARKGSGVRAFASDAIPHPSTAHDRDDPVELPPVARTEQWATWPPRRSLERLASTF
jgi:hypothetical protein